MEEQEQEVRECDTCGEETVCAYTTDPFSVEIRDDFTLGWYCDQCLYNSAMEV